jgi:hypothetical protein
LYVVLPMLASLASGLFNPMSHHPLWSHFLLLRATWASGGSAQL